MEITRRTLIELLLNVQASVGVYKIVSYLNVWCKVKLINAYKLYELLKIMKAVNWYQAICKKYQQLIKYWWFSANQV